MSLFVMACSAGKHGGLQAAGLKYDSRQHRTLFREFFLNGAFCSHDALILSAEHGFLSLTQTIGDYDLLLDDTRAAEIACSPFQQELVAKALVGHDEVYVYGGERYRAVVRQVLAALGFTGEVIDVVGPNRGCCDHFSALQAVFYGMSADA
jgi:hypothetical protein